MNWLAHVFLSKDHTNFKLGNLLTDASRPEHLNIDNKEFLAGVECHYEIDRFTDSHPLVKESKKIFFSKYRHFSAVLVDIIFDHLLAANWDLYSQQPYRSYVDDFYRELHSKELILHPESEKFVESIWKFDRLGMYDSIDGVGKAFERISSRIKLRTKIDICESVVELRENYQVLEDKFKEFFPELENHIRSCASVPL